jgi:hypothetical protein
MTRVIRGGGAPAPRSRDFKPSARVIDGARYAARLEAEQTIAKAHEEAAAIAERARREGEQRGRIEGLAALSSLQQRASEVADRSLDLIVMATRAVAERAIGSALATDEATLIAWAKQALAAFTGARKIAVHANETTLARLSGIRDVELVMDRDLPDFVLVARTELGDARIELGTQVEAFVASIRDVLASEVRSR